MLIFFLSKALHREGKTEGGMTRLSSYDLEPNSVDERGRDGARQFCWERQEKEIHKVHAASGAKVVIYEDWMDGRSRFLIVPFR